MSQQRISGCWWFLVGLLWLSRICCFFPLFPSFDWDVEERKGFFWRDIIQVETWSFWFIWCYYQSWFLQSFERGLRMRMGKAVVCIVVVVLVKLDLWIILVSEKKSHLFGLASVLVQSFCISSIVALSWNPPEPTDSINVICVESLASICTLWWSIVTNAHAERKCCCCTQRQITLFGIAIFPLLRWLLISKVKFSFGSLKLNSPFIFNCRHFLIYGISDNLPSALINQGRHKETQSSSSITSISRLIDSFDEFLSVSHHSDTLSFIVN